MTDANDGNDPELPGLALIALDLQEPFVRTLSGGREFTDRCAFAIGAANALKIPVAFTEQVPDKLGPTIAGLQEGVSDATVFAKNHFSCFGAPAFEAYLAEREIHHLLVTGLETPICVYQSVIEAVGKGFEVTLLSDCVGARRQEDAAAAVRAMAQAGAHVLPAETVVYSILGNTDHPCFREITALVKKHNSSPRK